MEGQDIGAENEMTKVFTELEIDSLAPKAVEQSRTDLLLAKLLLEVRTMNSALYFLNQEVLTLRGIAQAQEEPEKDDSIPFPAELG